MPIVSPLQRSRLKTALVKIARAGGSDIAGGLQDRLCRVFQGGTSLERAEVLEQVRRWAHSGAGGQVEQDAADAIGLLWAAEEYL